MHALTPATQTAEAGKLQVQGMFDYVANTRPAGQLRKTLSQNEN